MTLSDTLRPTRSANATSPQPLRGWRCGAAAAAWSAVPLIVVVLAAWLLASPRGSGLGQALGIGAGGWLLAHGARLGLTGGVVAFTPLLMLAGLLLLVRARARAMIDAHPATGPVWRGLIQVDLLGSLLGFIAGYAGVGLVCFGLTFLAPTRPTWSSALAALLLVPSLAVGAAAVEVLIKGKTLAERVGLPLPLRRALPAALKGALAAIALGSGLVLVSLLFHGGQVLHINSELAPGLVGGGLLWLGQVMALPNFGLWALSFAAGPGYALSSTANVSWSGADGALLPLVPIFAGSPQPAQFGWYAMVLVLVPIAAGVLTGRFALSNLPRLSATSSKLGVSLLAALLAAGVVAGADAVAGGSLGTRQLAELGAPALRLGLALAGEMALGALIAVGWDLSRLHRR